MAALTAPRNIDRLGHKADLELFKAPVAATTKLTQGGAVCLNSAGNAVPASTSTTLKTLGVAEQTYDNSAGNAGDVIAEARAGVFGFKNSTSTDAIAQADVGNDCYWVDDQTVAKTNGSSSRSVAGKIVSVSEGDSLVYVRCSLT